MAYTETSLNSSSFMGSASAVDQDSSIGKIITRDNILEKQLKV
jgi:hypothetical protein